MSRTRPIITGEVAAESKDRTSPGYAGVCRMVTAVSDCS
jgi:hypothetical protein